MSDNEMIAQFMGANTPIESEDVQSYEMYGVLECIEDGVSEKHFFLPEEMRFHTSWDWLIPVVDKCFDVAEDGDMVEIMHHLQVAVKDEVYREVIQFIDEYNARKL